MRRPLGPTVVPVGVAAFVAATVAYKVIRGGKGPRGSIILVGDSYAVGLGPACAEPPALPAGPGLKFNSNGVVGSNTAQWAEVVGEAAKQRNWKWLVWSLGTNDAGAPPDKLRGQIAHIAEVAKEHGSGLCWIRPPRAVLAKVPKAEAAWLEWGRVVGAGRTFDTDSHVKVELSPDGLHPLSYRPWAEALWKWLAILTA